MTTQPTLGKADMPRTEAEPSKAPGMKKRDMGPRADSAPHLQVEPLNGHRWSLYLQARMWRFLMALGMSMHRMAPPKPPKPSFSRTIPTTVSPTQGNVSILFYTPPDYEQRRKARDKPFPVVLNFHGGGFTLGNALDDARWAAALVDQVEVVVACVEYRRAPEHPFPTAVEDGVDALIYITRHAQHLHLDATRIVVSGFSSGGNMALAVPLRLQEELSVDKALANNDASLALDSGAPGIAVSPSKAPLVSVTGVKVQESPQATAQEVTSALKDMRIVAVCAWYPSTDYTRSREQRKATSPRKDKQLPAIFYKLFDHSYLQPPSLNMGNPYLSPGVASDELLASLPPHVILYTCEWDMLLDEANTMRQRLEKVGKTVKYTMVEKVSHGFDREPNPVKVSKCVTQHYAECCALLKELVTTGTTGTAKASEEGPQTEKPENKAADTPSTH